LIFLFVRVLPMISIFEVRTLTPQGQLKDGESHDVTAAGAPALSAGD